MEEEKWIQQILAGDVQSFSCFVAKYEKMAYNLAYRILGNREEAEEAVQDSFLKMYRSLAGFQGNSKFSTWFYRIVYHTAISAQRQQNYTTDIDDVPASEITEDETDSATAMLENKDRYELITKAMEKIPSDEALLLTLYYLEESSIEEIQQITGLSGSNVKVKLFRGRKHLYAEIEQMTHKAKIEML